MFPRKAVHMTVRLDCQQIKLPLQRHTAAVSAAEQVPTSSNAQ